MSRGVGGIAIFMDDTDRQRFSILLPRISSAFEWRCHAYCLMTTHYHLLIESQLTDLSRGMACLNSTHARAFNNRHERFGHLFSERFTSYVIESEEHYERAIRYILENPAKAGLCPDARAWPWSGIDEGQSLNV